MKTHIKAIAVLCAAGVVAAGVAGFVTRNKTPKLSSENLSYTASSKKNQRKLSDGNDFTYVAVKGGESVEVDLGGEKSFDEVVLQESGDNLNKFTISVHTKNGWEDIYHGDRIMQYRLCYVGEVVADKVKITADDAIAPLKLTEIQVRRSVKRTEPVRVSQYLCFDAGLDKMFERTDKGFSGYYDVVTDAIIIGSVFLDDNANVIFGDDGEAKFAERMEKFKEVIGDRDVKIWITVGTKLTKPEGAEPYDTEAEFFTKNADKIGRNLKALQDKYGFYGVDYDWEYPQKLKHWRAYDKLVIGTAEYLPVSVALPPWGVKFSKAAMDKLEVINVMAYDLFDSRGDHANSYTAGWGSIKYLRDVFVPPEKILLGVPTYGRTTNASGDAWPVYADYNDDMWTNKIEDYEYWSSETGKTEKCDAYINSYAQARDKAALAVDSGVGGIMIFREGCDALYNDKYCIHYGIGQVISAQTTD